MKILLLMLLVLAGCATPGRIIEGLPDDPDEEVIYVIQPKRSGFSVAVAETAKSLGMSEADTELELVVIRPNKKEELDDARN